MCAPTIWMRQGERHWGMPDGGADTSSGASTSHKAWPIRACVVMWQWKACGRGKGIEQCGVVMGMGTARGGQLLAAQSRQQ
jgi:hypothetical protein